MEGRSLVAKEITDKSNRCTLVLMLGIGPFFDASENKKYWERFGLNIGRSLTVKNVRHILPKAIKAFLDSCKDGKLKIVDANQHQGYQTVLSELNGFHVTLNNYHYINSDSTHLEACLVGGQQCAFDDIGVPRLVHGVNTVMPAAWLFNFNQMFIVGRTDTYYFPSRVYAAIDIAISSEEFIAALNENKIDSLFLQDKITRIIADRESIGEQKQQGQSIVKPIEINKDEVYAPPTDQHPAAAFIGRLFAPLFTPSKASEDWYTQSLKDPRLATAALYFYAENTAPFNTMTSSQHVDLVKSQPESASLVLRKAIDADELKRYVTEKNILGFALKK